MTQSASRYEEIEKRYKEFCEQYNLDPSLWKTHEDYSYWVMDCMAGEARREAAYQSGLEEGRKVRRLSNRKEELLKELEKMQTPEAEQELQEVEQELQEIEQRRQGEKQKWLKGMRMLVAYCTTEKGMNDEDIAKELEIPVADISKYR